MPPMSRPARRVRPDRLARATAPGARRIETAARRLFANRGYAGTSMAEIAAAAGVSKATVFHHYRSKRALYEALVGDAMAGFREQIVPLLDAGADLQGSLRDFAAAHVDRLTRMQGTMRLIAREMMSGTPASGELLSGSGMAQNFSLLVDALRRGQAGGTVRADVDPGLAVFLLLCANWFLFQTGSLTRRNPDLAVTASTDTYATELARLLYHGLAPAAGPQNQDSP
jgi:TetR/AcrR family transcriptional regulator